MSVQNPKASEDLLLTDVAVTGKPDKFDVLVRGGKVDSISPAGQRTHEPIETHPADGRWLLPGLWDHHVHFAQWTAQRQRIDVSLSRSAADCLDIVRREIVAHPDGNTTGHSRALIGYGFQDGVWPDAPSLEALDRVSPELPVILVSKDLHCGWVNTPAAKLMKVSPEPATGLVREGEWFGALTGLQDPSMLTVSDYREAAEAAAKRGVVGIVEFENTDNLSLWPARIDEGVDSLRVEVSVWPERLEAAIAAGVRTGDVLDSRGLVRMGPLKVVVDGSLNTRTAWCWDPYPGLTAGHPQACGVTTVPLDELEAVMSRAKNSGITAAIHAIGDRANSGVLDAFEELGMTGAIEHAQLVSASDFERFGALGLIASVQPEHAMDDRDVADRHWAGRTERAFAFGSLARAGALMRLGSDAPVSPLDPWIGMSAAVTRFRDGLQPWHPEQVLDLDTALAATTRGRSEVEVGSIGDLVLVEQDPFSVSGEDLRQMPVAATMVGGRFTWYNL
ncbi:amidohydrolase [Brevibacterium sp. FME17]|uniref:amidohydrolase n=1 Tax=Brevibacterium sp. FME17 TaxID=2742606 RepID=UPI00186811F5|nr:amidohydrolase family protein [Brevibacterium sp. FME17]